jgi:hypothetical protein
MVNRCVNPACREEFKHEPLRITTVALDGPAGLAAMAAAARARARAKFAKRDTARFFELGFLAERGCLSGKTAPREVA